MNIDTHTYRSSHGFDSRIRFLVMHYTAGNFAGSIDALTGPTVSAHYLVPDPTDKTYNQAGFTSVQVFNLVNESDRAWHAGTSAWRGRTNLNDSAIGVEIVNRASVVDGNFAFPPFNALQIEAVKDLALDILRRNPSITPINVVGHSDIAPMRKSDPGPLFPWHYLYQAGIGAWYDEVVKGKYMQQYAESFPTRQLVFQLFTRYGYDVSAASSASGFQLLVRAFQMHFRPANYDGVLDRETAAILAALVEKYC